MFIYYIKRMLHFIKKCIHGIIVHPILPFLPIKLSKRIHNSNSAWVWGKKNRDIWLIDEDFDKMPYIWKAPPDESPINIQQLISFQKSLTMTPQNIRESIRPLSWTAQMKKVIDELDIRPQHTILEK